MSRSHLEHLLEFWHRGLVSRLRLPWTQSVPVEVSVSPDTYVELLEEAIPRDYYLSPHITGSSYRVGPFQVSPLPRTDQRQGQTTTEYMLVISVIVIAMWATALWLVPGLQSGLEALVDDVAGGASGGMTSRGYVGGGGL